MDALGIEGWSLGEPPDGPFHPGRSATVLIGGASAGVIGEIHPRAASSLEIAGRVAVAVLGLASLRRAARDVFDLREIPRFPPVRRDLAFLVPVSTPAGAVHAVLREAGGPLLDRSTLFDVYVGERVASGTKSLAFSVEFRAADRTLTDEEAQSAVDRIVDRLSTKLDATLRTG
jgi:phenylalanyl-tRNA synthetase beta chain